MPSTPGGGRKRRSSMRREGVAAVLNELQEHVVDRVRRELEIRREAKFHGMSDSEIETTSRIAGREARHIAVDAIGSSYQLGVKGVPMPEVEHPTEKARHEMVTMMTARLLERINYNQLTAEEVKAQARAAGLILKNACTEPVATAYSMGVDRNATPDDHNRPTTPVPPKRKTILGT